VNTKITDQRQVQNGIYRRSITAGKSRLDQDILAQEGLARVGGPFIAQLITQRLLVTE